MLSHFEAESDASEHALYPCVAMCEAKLVLLEWRVSIG